MAEVLHKVKDVGGVTVHYKLILPNGYDAAKAYPAVLAFPGGPPTTNIVQGTVDRNWRAQAEQRGYIVVVPPAPDGDLFFEEGARVFPEFITKLLADFKVQDGRFQIAGMSNGGLSAFHIAAMYPKYFLSVTGFPDYLVDPIVSRTSSTKPGTVARRRNEVGTPANPRGRPELLWSTFSFYSVLFRVN